MELTVGWNSSHAVQAMLLHSSWVRRFNPRLRQLVKVALRYLFQIGKVASQSALRAMQELQRLMHMHSAACTLSGNLISQSALSALQWLHSGGCTAQLACSLHVCRQHTGKQADNRPA
jgi:hypothetical protein